MIRGATPEASEGHSAGNEPEAVVDEFSHTVKAGLSDDQRTLYPQVERGFLAMAS